MIALQSSADKGGLDWTRWMIQNVTWRITYFVPDWPDMDITRSCGRGLRAELSVRTIGEAGNRRVDTIRDLLDGE